MSDDDQRTCHDPDCGGFCDRPCNGGRGGCGHPADLCDRCGVCGGCGWRVYGPKDTARTLRDALSYYGWSSTPIDEATAWAIGGGRRIIDDSGKEVGCLGEKETWALIKAMEVEE